MSDYILEMNDITKEFPGVLALNRVNFKVSRGEIHCLVGENGAGKSTLMKILSGVYPHGSYTGDIIIDGKEQIYKSIADSEKAGIAIINQELALIPDLPVYENIFFGHEITNRGIINWNETIVKAGEALKRVKLNINPTVTVRSLGVGGRQLVEISKALSKDVKLLILDEPTSALNETDSENLLSLLRELKKEGVTCIMISHKLGEVLSIADTITVLRDGATICSLNAKKDNITESTIIKNMVGRDITNIYPKRENNIVGDICFEVKNWSLYDKQSDRNVLKNININLRKGEIIGIAGLMGSGRTEFARSLFGNPTQYKITSGSLAIEGDKKTFKHPSDAITAGLAYVTEDRKGDGLILIKDVKENITFANLDSLIEGIVINENEEISVATEYCNSLDIKTPSIAQLVRNLSGGNQQKVSVAKWLFTKPKILILDEPTRGIDVGAKYEMYTIMNKLVEQGMSIIMISSELLEILGMTDRIYVISAGKITGEIPTSQATEESIMALATTTI